MTISTVLSAQVSAAQVASLQAPGAGSVVSLESRLLQSFAASAVDAERSVATINTILKRDDLSNPEQLARLQQLSNDYVIDVSMVNTLVRKGVSTVETLLRSS
ncbi:type III secretion system inner rod subunit SctI [Pseudomonas sp. NPDC090202]|uniref:type III secretion system inner rod subunit SctI n=1 Tax=unclassified Pseudomonas TaxID=196821 RepID=UPI0037F4E4ED